LECPVCKSENVKNNICDNCEINVLIADKLHKLSNSYFYKALEKSKEGNLTEAESHLKNSLHFNKMNSGARNLLGLIYFETGLVNDALKQFEIGKKLDENNKAAISYLETIRSDSAKLEALQKTIESYNHALMSFKQKNDDVATIALRKTVEINPKFVSAHNLLALAYINQKKNSQAMACLNRVMNIDNGNETALTLMRELQGDKKNPVRVEPEKKDKTPKNEKTGNYNLISDNRRGLGIAWVFALIVGLAVGAGIFLLIVIPQMTTSNAEIIEKWRTEADILKKENIRLTEENTTTIAELETAKKNLEIRNQELESQVSLHDKMENMNTASDLIRQGRYEEAAILLKSIDKNGLEEELLNKFAELEENSYQRTANILYQRGLARYRANDYEEALNAFNECLDYADDESAQYGDSLYYLGEIALSNGDEDTAMKYFETVVEDFEGIARNYWSARNRTR